MGSAQDVDTLSLDDRKAYTRKMGKWRAHTLTTLQDRLFGAVVEVMHMVKKPWIHLSNFLKQKLPYGEDGHLSQLVCGKAVAIHLELDRMMFGFLACQLQVQSQGPRSYRHTFSAVCL